MIQKFKIKLIMTKIKKIKGTTIRIFFVTWQGTSKIILITCNKSNLNYFISSYLHQNPNPQVEHSQDYCYFHRQFLSRDIRNIVIHRCQNEGMLSQHTHNNDRKTNGKNSHP